MISILLALFVATPISFLFLAYALSEFGIFYTRLQTGNIKAIMRSDRLHRWIHDVRGKKLVNQGGDKWIFEDGEEPRSRFNKVTGLYWVGFPPFARVYTFELVKERENADGKNASEWIVSDHEPVKVDTLRFRFPRPYIMRMVELKDKTTIDLLAVAILEVVYPYIPLFIFKGDFFRTTGSDIRDAMLASVCQFDIDYFVAAGQGEGLAKKVAGPLLETTFNTALIDHVGLRLVALSIPQWDPSDPALRDAIAAKKTQFELGEGLKAKALAEAIARERTADAKKKEVQVVVDALGGDEKAAAEVLIAEAQRGLTHRVEVKDIKIGGGE